MAEGATPYNPPPCVAICPHFFRPSVPWPCRQCRSPESGKACLRRGPWRFARRWRLIGPASTPGPGDGTASSISKSMPLQIRKKIIARGAALHYPIAYHHRSAAPLHYVEDEAQITRHGTDGGACREGHCPRATSHRARICRRGREEGKPRTCGRACCQVGNGTRQCAAVTRCRHRSYRQQGGYGSRGRFDHS